MRIYTEWGSALYIDIRQFRFHPPLPLTSFVSGSGGMGERGYYTATCSYLRIPIPCCQNLNAARPFNDVTVSVLEQQYS